MPALLACGIFISFYSLAGSSASARAPRAEGKMKAYVCSLPVSLLLPFRIDTMMQESRVTKQITALSPRKAAAKGSASDSDVPTCGLDFILFTQKMLTQPGLQNIRSIAVCEIDYPDLGSPA